MGTIVAELVETGEKRDQRGRRVTPAIHRAKMVAVYEQSGLTMAQFARQERIKYATFAGWVAKAQRSPAKPPLIKFSEVKLPVPPREASSARAIEVRLPDGTVLRGERVTDIVALVRALRN
jgi:transposase-like protein